MMKWWGWGDDEIAFTHEDKPALAPFIEREIGVDVTRATHAPVAFSELDIPAPRIGSDLAGRLRAIVGAEHASDDPLDRLVHARGKSLRDLLAMRAGQLGRLPDIVLRPGSEQELTAILAAALDADVVVIPFGGGSSITGSLEAPADEQRPVVSVDLERLNRVLSVDPDSRLAEIQAGATGPELERQLNAAGWTLGHFPDSFTSSTLGGWIATRSSGMQSDKYGDIADLTRGLRVVAPSGTLVLRPLPSTSSGPSVREMILGSEGRLGLIASATVQVHRIPAERAIIGYLLPSWQASLAAMRAIAATGSVAPSVTRVSDAAETAFSFVTRKTPSATDRIKSAALDALLRRRGIDRDSVCLAFVGYEGSARSVRAGRRAIARIVSDHGGLVLGRGPGELYDQKKFDTPYIRDYLLDRGVLADVSETAAPWSRLAGLHEAVTGAAHGAFAQLGTRGFLMCHLSHSYHSGACLYFTFAFVPTPAAPPVQQYALVKNAIQQAFIDAGGTLSHHHAVGTEHAPWLEQDISAPGVAMVRSLFDGIDPGRNLNPGKIV